MSRPQVSDPLFIKDAGMIELNPMSRLGVSPGWVWDAQEP